jgi:hypothetical protein
VNRSYFNSSIQKFLETSNEEILGVLSKHSEFAVELTQRDAWEQQILLLKNTLQHYTGKIYFEYAIPRMGRRIDAVLLIKHVLFIIEFKVGEKEFPSYAIDQVWDYALDLKNFHETSHDAWLAPVLIATEAKSPVLQIIDSTHNDRLLSPICGNAIQLKEIIDTVLSRIELKAELDAASWESGSYSPTPTIIEAAMALYNQHSVEEISRADASAKNLRKTSRAITAIIENSRLSNEKAICFVTGVPGAGKTLVGLDVATKHLDKDKRETSVFLSGNGPLVAILREALTRDKVKREKALGKKVRKGDVMTNVKSFIQNVHHFRDEYLRDTKAPVDHVAIFDEAQRAWNHEQTAKFMARKKNVQNFRFSEPEFLISCLDRHNDWAVIVCLVGGGQEINTGEAGIKEWFNAVNRSFPNWKVYVSPQIEHRDYDATNELYSLNSENVIQREEMHLSVSMRSFRAEKVSSFVKTLLDLDESNAQLDYQSINKKYPIVMTRKLSHAKRWLKQQARGSERYGIVVSSQAQRLKPYAIDVKSPVDPIHWFLDDKSDVRSSYYLEDVATEFHVQGLELDWACVTWDADFRYNKGGWETFSFVGDKWHNIKKAERKQYLKNAYRVLLTRARQGMVIVVPEGDVTDPTRHPRFYNETFDYLKRLGIGILPDTN